MKLQLKRSNVLQGGSAKEPTAAQLDYGELAVNYNSADPQVFFKDSADSIVKIAVGGLQAVCDNGSTTTTGATFGDGDITLSSSGAITAAGTVTANLFSGPLPYSDLTGTPTIPSNNNELTNGAGYITIASVPTNNNQLTNGAGYVTSSGNTVIGTDSDLDTSGAEVVDQLNMTDGVITSHNKRTLTLADLGYTGATNANYITNNNQLTNGAGYYKSGDSPSFATCTATSFVGGTFSGDGSGLTGTGSLKLLSTVNASGASTVNLTGIDTTYTSYVIKMTDASITCGTQGRHIMCHFLINNAVSSTAGFYSYAGTTGMRYQAGGSIASPSFAAPGWTFNCMAGGGQYMGYKATGEYNVLTQELGNDDNINNMEMTLMNPGASAGNHAFWWTNMSQQADGSGYTKTKSDQGLGWFYSNTNDVEATTGSAISGVRFFVTRNNYNNGTISGKFQLYGVV